MDTPVQGQPGQPATNRLPKFLTTVTPLSKLLAGMLFITLPFLGFYLGIQYQKNNSTITSPSKSTSVTPTFTPQQSIINSGKTGFPDWHLISKKKYKDFEIGSFNFSGIISGPDAPIASLFVVAPIVENQPKVYTDSYAVGMIPDFYFNENLFDIVGDNIYIIDSQLNDIKVFTAEYFPATQASVDFYSMAYKMSIPAPEYKIGTIYTIKCDSIKCTIGSAFHQESGCEFELNVSTQKYSIPICYSPGPGGEYTPEKI